MKVEWRLCCNLAGVDPYHRSHVYSASQRVTKDAETRAEFLRSRDADASMRMPSNWDCVPWHFECREVGDWTDPTAEFDPDQVALW